MEPANFKLWHGVRDLAHRYGLPPFWRWWVTQLGSFVPPALKAAVGRRRARPVLAFDAGTAVLWVPRTSAAALELVEVARIAMVGDATAVSQAGRAAMESLPPEMRGSGSSGTKVILALPRSQVLRKEFALPAAVEENLKQAIAWDLDRHTPFPPEQLYFDAVVTGRDTQKKEIRVDWAAAQRTHVDQARRQAEGWGAIVVGVTPDCPLPGHNAIAAPSRLNLLPDEARVETPLWRRWQILAPLALLLLAGGIAVVLPLWQKRDHVIVVARIAEEERVKAAAADALRSELERSTGDYNFALARKYAYPPTIQVIDDVTKLLPDDTWLLQFELKTVSQGKDAHREMLLRGESGSAGRLIALLEGSQLFEQATPRSPMTKIQPGPGEIFDLGAQLKSPPLPAMVELASLPALPPVSAPTAVPVAPAAPVTAPATVPAAPTSPATPGGPAARTPTAAPPAAPPPAAAPSPAAAPAGAHAPPESQGMAPPVRSNQIPGQFLTPQAGAGAAR